MNCIFKPFPATQYGAVQSCYHILSHDTLHHRLSSNSGLENGDRQLGHLFCYYKSHKNTDYTNSWRVCALCNRHFKSVLFEIWLRHPANCILVEHIEGSATARLSVQDFEIHWISRGFQISEWISGFQSGFLDFK